MNGPYKVVFIFAQLDPARWFLADREKEGWTGLIVDEDTGQEVTQSHPYDDRREQISAAEESRQELNEHLERRSAREYRGGKSVTYGLERRF